MQSSRSTLHTFIEDSSDRFWLNVYFLTQFLLLVFSDLYFFLHRAKENIFFLY